MTEEQKFLCLLEQLEKELEGELGEEQKGGVEGVPPHSALREATEGEKVGEGTCLSEQEGFQKGMEIKLQHEQDSLLQQVCLSVLYVLIYS